MATEHEYLFNRDAAASVRLNLQHYLWIATTGFLLHPSIPVPDDAVIADVGTGTGIFSLALAPQLPAHARIEASDISLAQGPPRGWWPSNVTFTETDVFAPITPERQARYDVVHLRLFMCVIPHGDPRPLLGNVLKLLKPGGYLQWQEYDPLSDRVVTTPEVAAAATAATTTTTTTVTAPKLRALKALLDAQAQDFGWTRDFHERFAAHGAELVEVCRHRSDDAAAHHLVKQDITFLAVREWAGMLRRRDPVTATKLLDAVAEAETECWALQRGTVVDSDLITWVARKL